MTHFFKLNIHAPPPTRRLWCTSLGSLSLAEEIVTFGHGGVGVLQFITGKFNRRWAPNRSPKGLGLIPPSRKGPPYCQEPTKERFPQCQSVEFVPFLRASCSFGQAELHRSQGTSTCPGRHPVSWTCAPRPNVSSSTKLWDLNSLSPGSLAYKMGIITRTSQG